MVNGKEGLDDAEERALSREVGSKFNELTKVFGRPQERF